MHPESSSYGKPIGSLGILSNMAGSQNQQSKTCLTLLEDTDSFLRQIRVPRVGNLSFGVDGIPFYTKITPHGATAELIIWCALGYLPFSVTSSEKRQALIEIVESARLLPLIKMGVDQHMKIIVTATFVIPNPPTPNYVFYPLIQFMQVGRPYIRLIGEHL